MKKNQLILFISIMLFIGMLFPFILSGQNRTDKTFDINSLKTDFDDRVIKFDNDTKKEEIIINVKEETPVMELSVTGKVSYGKLSVEVFEPNGNRVRKFIVKVKTKSKNPDEKGMSIGEINKTVKNPELGNWKIELSGIKVTGEINIKANFDNDYYINAPELFNPHKDHTFNLETYNISEITSFKVFNRSGKVVFLSNNLDKGWDGTVDDDQQESASYHYIIQAITSAGKEITKTGDLFLVRKH